MSIFDEHKFPEGAAEIIGSQGGLRQVQLDDGVMRLMSGHDKGVAYRFFVHPEYNPVKSKLSGYECFDEYDCIEWIIDKDNKPTELVRFLPPELLSFDKDGDVVGGRYKEEYKSFKAGRSAPGTSLAAWGVLPDGELAALAKNAVYTVEQLAASSRAKIQSTYSPTVMEAFERAIQHVNTKHQRDLGNEQLKKMAELQEANDKLQERLAALEVKTSEPKEDKLNVIRQKLAEKKNKTEE